MNTNFRFKTLVILIVVALWMNSCKESNATLQPVDGDPISIVDLDKEKVKVKETLTAMWAAIENEDMEAYATYIHDDFTQFGETDSILRVGKKAELKGISSWVENAENIHTEMIDPRVTIVGEMAYITYYWSDQGAENGKAFATQGKSTRIFVKEQGRWLCIHGHYTSLP